MYATVSDIAGYVDWQPGLDAATVLERDRWDRQTLVRIEMTRGGRPIRSELRFSYSPGERVRWYQERLAGLLRNGRADAIRKKRHGAHCSNRDH